MDAVELLISNLRSDDETERNLAAQKLAKIGDVRAIRPLIECFLDPSRQAVADIDGDVSWAIPLSIASFGEAAVHELAKFENQKLIWVLGSTKCISAIDLLIEWYFKESFKAFHTRTAIAYAIAKVGTSRARELLSELHQTEKDDDLRQMLISAFRSIDY